MIPLESSFKKMTPMEAIDGVAKRIDVRSSDAFEERHLPDALNVCVYETAFLEKLRELVPDSSEPLIVYGESGRFHAAALAAGRLAEAGYEKVFVLAGGIEAWQEAGLPTEGNRSEALDDKRAERLRFELDSERSRVRWIGRNLTNQHEGGIACSGGFIEVREGQILSGEVEVDMRAIACSDIADTKMNQMLIKHLESIDFFQTSKFPKAKFEIQRFYPDPDVLPGQPNAHVEGVMEVRGRRKSLRFEASFAPIEKGFVFQAQFDFDRTLFGALYGSGQFFEGLGMHLVNDLVNLQVTAFFVGGE